MSVRHVFLVLGLPLAATAFSGPANAQSCEFSPAPSSEAYLGQLDRLNAQGCYGRARDDDSLTRDVVQRLSALEREPATLEHLEAVRDRLLELLTAIHADLARSGVALQAPWDAYDGVLRDQLRAVTDEVRLLNAGISAEVWRRDGYGFFERPGNDRFLIHYETDVRADCRSTELTEECRRTLAAVARLTRYINLVHRILQLPVRVELERFHREVVKLDEQWDYYFEEARSQYYWELLANGALYQPADDRLAGPPDSQLVLFHPTAAMEYVGSGPQNESAYDVVAVVELIGYNRWSYSADSFLARWPFGVSAVATYTPETTGDRVGYGAMIHIKHDYSIGATRRDTGAGTETTWLLSVDLTKLFLDKSSEVRRRFRGIEDDLKAFRDGG